MIKRVLAVSVLLAFSGPAFSVTTSVALPSSGGLFFTDTLQLNDFTVLSTDGDLGFGSILDGVSPAIGSAGSRAFFTFDTTLVDVTEVSLSGWSNNVPVDISAFDIEGNLLLMEQTDNSWSNEIILSEAGSIASLEVRLLESEISALSLTYQPVTAVPLPAAVWLFGSGLMGIAAAVRRRR